MFWPTERAKPKSFGATTVMFDSFVKKENIVIRKFIISPSIVSNACMSRTHYIPALYIRTIKQITDTYNL